MNQKNKIEYLFKILVVGDIGTGKTSIIKRLVYNIFSEYYKSTVGVDFALKVINLKNNIVVSLQLWDIAGQERFGNMTRIYYKEALGAFVVFDISRINSFESVLKWKNDIDNKITIGEDNKSIPIILLANKCDLPNKEHIKSKQELDIFCEENKFVGWEFVSAKDNINIDKSTFFLVKKILELTNNNLGIINDNDDIITNFAKKKKQKNNCCN